jgi:hypothetical protein
VSARDIEAKLDAIARAGGIIPARAYYIWGEFRLQDGGETLYTDEGHEYCRTCADALLAKAFPLLPKEEQDEHRVSSTELHHEDTCKHCIICGTLLDYALNPTGVESELDHYRHYNVTAGLSPGDAFHIARMIEAAPTDADVLRLARRALRRLSKTQRSPRPPARRT